MPTYDYVCDACKHSFELFHSIKDEPKKQCPECGKKKLRRQIGPGAAIVFKGSGFYITDYRSESYKKAAAADKPADSSSSGGKTSEKSTDKSAEKPAAKTTDTAKPKHKDKGQSKH
jgi:putative FmdB family regulatory protein